MVITTYPKWTLSSEQKKRCGQSSNRQSQLGAIWPPNATTVLAVLAGGRARRRTGCRSGRCTCACTCCCTCCCRCSSTRPFVVRLVNECHDRHNRNEIGVLRSAGQDRNLAGARSSSDGRVGQQWRVERLAVEACDDSISLSAEHHGANAKVIGGGRRSDGRDADAVDSCREGAMNRCLVSKG